MIVIACPGQGSQTPGFLTEWLSDPADRAFLEEVSQNIGVDLIEHGTVSDAETIRDTAIAQPLIVAASLLAWRALERRTDLSAAAVAGHSVGEFGAAAIAGVFSEHDALSLVATRGAAMAQAATEAATSMAAVIGGVEDQVLEAIESFGLTPANRNGGGQIVAAGAEEAIAKLVAEPPRGARVIQLQVAGAFHTEYMASAIPTLQEAASSVTVNDPSRVLWTNADGSRVERGTEFRDLLITQVSNPVRWDSCMQSFTEAGITAFIELLPGGALSGIAKRGMRGVPSVAIKTPADLDAAVELITSANE
ncbi:ACP S-malonyltransferase [Leucobacter sp. UCMA 4100]|uniref:ACP S-malonyltransferase n=1 Tax=Leucobacter sp. UCMA 4100 TaxID=2810534 RepID=UPI0022EB26B6|nr:ACP S-malonyltransferase [Leucobacter sp. UCMA 4100]MDA3145878.1 ACP S-malonyltransferase [Leucobacter sp. UCMA 4100]